MSEQTDVKVFISWSGDLAKGVAVALRAWLPLMFDRVTSWASDTDIAAGQRGLAQIESELKNTRFGVVVVTAENQHAPWLNFEAGALSKTVPGELDQRVVPLLVDLAGPAQLTGPLSQFQAKLANKAGVKEVIRSLATVAGIAENVADERFGVYWPKLEERIQAAKAAAAAEHGDNDGEQSERPEGEVLDEILLHVRALRADSDGRAVSRGRHASRQSYRRFVERLGAQFDLKLLEIRTDPEGAPVELLMEPASQYSSEAAHAFEQAYQEGAAAEDSGVAVSVIPF